MEEQRTRFQWHESAAELANLFGNNVSDFCLQKELNELLQNLLDRIEDAAASKAAAKPSGSKSRGSTSR